MPNTFLNYSSRTEVTILIKLLYKVRVHQYTEHLLVELARSRVIQLEVQADVGNVKCGTSIQVEPDHLVGERVFVANGSLVEPRGDLRWCV